MASSNHNLIWEHRQAELWDRIFQVTQDVISLADTLGDSGGSSIIREQLVRSAIDVGKWVVRATASSTVLGFEENCSEARLKAVETDYWLRLAYVIQQQEDVQRDLSSIITQYSSIVDLLEKIGRHVQEKRDVMHHRGSPNIAIE